MHVPSVDIKPLDDQDLEPLAAYWSAAHPLHPLSPGLLRERLLGPPDAQPGLTLGAWAQGRLVAAGAGVPPSGEDGRAGLRWLGVVPELAGHGIEGRLALILCERLAALGAREVRTMATPPYYIRPGIDIREIGLLATLLDMGWEHVETNFNMTVDLARWAKPSASDIEGPDAQGVCVRRARAEDRPALKDYLAAHWRASLHPEVLLALGHAPSTLFLATRGGQIVGFAATEANQCLGSFGPTGVTPDARGRGLGKRLLWACLADFKARGLATCQIGWVGPVAYYHRACDARLGPAYWVLRRRLAG